MAHKLDIEIARAASPQNIREIGAKTGHSWESMIRSATPRLLNLDYINFCRIARMASWYWSPRSLDTGR
ncbi:MAG: hypothetical protein R3E95_10865 [Thiolinea sp.]